ncbi:MAG: hypothetical protein AB7F74_17470 [Parvibaculaceae bacterium]
MNTLSKFSLVVLGGAGMLMLSAPADAATGRVKFRASFDEIRRYCDRIDVDFWWTKRTYGCGKIGCANGNCVVTAPKRPPPPQYPPPLYAQDRGGKNGGDKGGPSAGGGGGGGNGGGNGSSSAAGAN